MKMMAGVTPGKVEIEPGTTMNFWAPTQKIIGKSTETATSGRPSVVLLHGFFLDGIFTWFLQVLALAGKYDVYVPDFVFFGDSTTDKQDRSISFQAECLAKGLRKLGVKRCTVVGFSYGGFVVFKLAKLHPGLADSVIATGAAMELDESHESLINMLLPESIEKLKLLISIGSDKKLFTSFPNFVYRDLLEAMYSHRKERAELIKALVEDEFYLYPAKYSQKLHLLWGEKDKIINLDTACNIKAQLGDEVTLECIPHAGHIANIERPRRYNHHLRRILASFHSHMVE